MQSDMQNAFQEWNLPSRCAWVVMAVKVVIPH